jgi:hypothetical protein
VVEGASEGQTLSRDPAPQQPKKMCSAATSMLRFGASVDDGSPDSVSNTRMLQIGSGKLFSHGVGRTNELRGVLYSNLTIHRNEPLETAVGRILPLSLGQGQPAFIFEFTERMEGDGEAKPGILVSRTIAPYLDEFAVVFAFALNVTCSPDPDLVGRLVGTGRLSQGRHRPSNYVNRVFDPNLWCQDDEVLGFTAFVSDLFRLQRKSYRAAVRAMQTYVTGLHRTADDPELAYTMLVAALESLAQGFDGHRAEWSDYDATKRAPIDAALEGGNPALVHRVREAILENEHVALARRFRDFTMAHVEPAFFREEAVGVAGPIGRSALPDALRQAYKLRSGFIHRLDELPRLLTIGDFATDSTRIDGTPTLSFRGLARLVRHVIFQFVRQQRKLDAEPYDYRLEQSGVVQLELAPEYWIGNTANLDPESGLRRLEGHLEQLAYHLSGAPDAKITDLRDLLGAVEGQLAGMTPAQRRPFVALHVMFNALLPSDQKMASVREIEKYHREFDDPSPEAMVVNLLFQRDPPWSLAQHREALERYFTRRSRKAAARLPSLFEAGVTLHLAERYRLDGDAATAHELVGFAVDNMPGHGALRDLEANFDPAKAVNWRGILLPPDQP